MSNVITGTWFLQNFNKIKNGDIDISRNELSYLKETYRRFIRKSKENSHNFFTIDKRMHGKYIIILSKIKELERHIKRMNELQKNLELENDV